MVVANRGLCSCDLLAFPSLEAVRITDPKFRSRSHSIPAHPLRAFSNTICDDSKPSRDSDKAMYSALTDSMLG